MVALKKENRLVAITSEVDQLHPMLKKLFSKLPGITEVEYTHGTGEMGADFVISKKHDVFETTDYIGVVAKVGKVVQDYADIERQIDECSIPRTFFSGKEKIRINEIWVIVTEHITKGAQQKIHEKFKNRKIYFIDGGRLEKLIDEYLPNFWIDVNLEVSEYLAEVKKQNIQIDRSVSLIQVSEEWFYIEQDIYNYPRREYRISMRKSQRKASRVEIVQEIEKNKIILIEGGMGAGKSKLMRNLTEYYADSNIYLRSHILPIPISYKEFSDKYDCNIRTLIDVSVKSSLRNEVSGNINYLVLIDGFDEKDSSPEQQIEKLSGIVSSLKSQDNVKAIITSRYIEAIDQSDALASEFSRYELRALTFKKMLGFLTALCAKFNIKSRIVNDLHRSPLFKELPKSPIAAILLAKLLNENQQDLPSNLTELYAKYLELMLGRWDIDKGLQSQKEYQALDNIMMNLSRYMLENEIPALCIDEVKSQFNNYLKGRNLGLDANALFEKMKQRCEMINVENTTNTFSFKHRTFAEYFFAKSFINSHDIIIDNRVYKPYWMNSYFFYLGLLKDCPDVLKAIAAVPAGSENERWVKVINTPNYLLAAYATPYEVICEGIADSLIEGARLYLDIVSGKYPDSPLTKFTRMQLLYLLQHVLRNSYSYEFLLGALEVAALRIDDMDIANEIKCYALFFLNVAYIDISDGQSFDFLLKNHHENMPIDLLMAYSHESKNIQEHSELMKKQDRRIKKILKRNKPLTDFIEDMYEKPLSISYKKTLKIQMSKHDSST